MSAVATPDLTTTDQGYSPTPTDEFPADPSELIPETSDSAIYDDGADGQLALAPEAPDGETPEVPPLDRDSIVAEVRAQMEAEHTDRLSKYAAIKDREVAQMQQQLVKAMARAKVQQDWMAQYINQNGGDPRDLAVLENALRTAEDAATYQQANTQQATQSIHGYFEQRFQERNQAAQQAGDIVLDPSDPEVQQWREYVRKSVDHYGPAATRALNSPVASQSDLQAMLALQEVGRRMHEFETNKRALMKTQSATALREKAAADQKAAKLRQGERGTQSTASRNGGGGGMSVEAAAKKAWELHPMDSNARLKFMSDNVHDEPKRQRR